MTKKRKKCSLGHKDLQEHRLNRLAEIEYHISYTALGRPNSLYIKNDNRLMGLHSTDMILSPKSPLMVSLDYSLAFLYYVVLSFM